MIDLYTAIGALEELEKKCKEAVQKKIEENNAQEALRLQQKREGVRMSIETLKRLKGKKIEII